MGYIRVVTPAPELPITLDQAKAHLRISENDDDDYITNALQAAVNYAENFTGLALIDTKFEYYVDEFPLNGKPLQLPKAPLLEVQSITGEGAAFTSYSADYANARVYLPTGVSWPSVTGIANVGIITFRAGFVETTSSPQPEGIVPADILQAILLLLGTLYMQRETLVVGTIVSKAPFAAEELLRRHRIETSLA